MFNFFRLKSPFYAYLDFEFSTDGNIGNYEERPEYSYNDPKDGTKAEWNKIEIGNSNEKLTEATIHYSSHAPASGSCGATKTKTIAKAAKYNNPLSVKAKKPTVKYSKLKLQVKTLLRKA